MLVGTYVRTGISRYCNLLPHSSAVDLPSMGYAAFASTAFCSATSQSAPARCSRRRLLSTAGAAVSGALLAGVAPSAAHADRTGKFSSRLTARRRYLPRIIAGSAAVVAAAAGETDARTVASIMFDLGPALHLFASAGFGEGAAAQPTLRALSAALRAIDAAAPAADTSPAEMKALIIALRDYAAAADIDVPALAGP